MRRLNDIENPEIQIYPDSGSMGAGAAEFVSRILGEAIDKKGEANMILATGTSQFTFLSALKTKAIDWKRIRVFHLDEYKGLPDTHPASFRRYLRERILEEVSPGKVFYLKGDGTDLEQVMDDYEQALRNHPIDIACIGIGENGHIAFNDPPVADFNDPQWVKVVRLDAACRRQQMGEGWFESLEEVPEEAVTLTVPAIMAARVISCVVPDKRKQDAVYGAVRGEVGTGCPASVLRTHPHAVLFLDEVAAGRLG